MGGFYNSIHVRGNSQEKILEQVRGSEFAHEGCIIGTESDSWVPVFISLEHSVLLTVLLSESLGADVLMIDIHDDDIFSYVYYRNGEEIDSFSSWPDYFEGSEMIAPDVGDPLKLVQEMEEKIKGKLDLSSCTSPEDFMKVLGEINTAFQDAGFIQPSPSRTESDEESGNPECFAEILENPEDVRKLAKILDSMREHTDVFASQPAGRFCELLKLPNGINSYEYLLEEELPDGYVHVL